MEQQTIMLITSISMGVIALISIFVSYYYHIKSILSKAATEAINVAEESEKIGAEKFAEAVAQVKALVPAVMKPFITDALIEVIVQATFDQIKSFAEKQNKKK